MKTKKINYKKTPAITPAKNILIERGMTQGELAQKINRDLKYVNRILNGVLKCYPARLLVSLELGKPINELWPE